MGCCVWSGWVVADVDWTERNSGVLKNGIGAVGEAGRTEYKKVYYYHYWSKSFLCS